MQVRSAQAEWNGDLPTGRGTIRTETGAVDGQYSFSSRFGMGITRIDLVCRAAVPGLDEAGFQEHAQAAKVGCPISKALAANEITLDAALEG